VKLAPTGYTRVLECEACPYWVHIQCGGITPNEYKNFQKNTYLSWECPKCLLPNLSDSFVLDNPIALNNSYESLSSNSNTSITDYAQYINTHRSNYSKSSDRIILLNVNCRSFRSESK
jgi:hypothetical protein